MEVAGAKKSQARCGRSRGDKAALGARGRGEGAAPVLRRRRRQGSDVLGQRDEAKPGSSERAPMAGWRCGGDVVDGEARGRMGVKGIGRGVTLLSLSLRRRIEGGGDRACLSLVMCVCVSGGARW